MPALVKENPLDKLVAVRLDAGTHEQLLAVAAEQQTLSEMLRGVIKDHIQKASTSLRQ